MKISVIEPFENIERVVRARAATGQDLGELIPAQHHSAIGRCTVEGVEVREWAAYIPDHDDTIKIYMVPKVVGAAAAAVAAAVGGGLVGSVVVAGLNIALAVGLSFAINALMPKPSLGYSGATGARTRREEAFGVAGLQNTVAPGTPKFVVYGERRIYGHIIGSRVDVASDGKSMSFSVLYLMGDTGGDGYESITDIEINRTPVADLDDVTTEVRLGTGTQNVINGFEETAQTFYDGRQLAYNIAVVYTLTDTNASRVNIILEWPGGLKKIDTQTGEPLPGKSVIKIEFKRVSDPTWLLNGFYTVEKKSDSKLFKEIEVIFGSSDPWEVRVTETHDKNSTDPPTSTPDPNLFNVEEIQTGTRTYPNSALLSVKGIGTNVIQSIQQLEVSAKVRGKKVNRWNGIGFDGPLWTQQRAWIVRDMLTHPKVGLGNRVAESFHDDDAAKWIQDNVWDSSVAGLNGEPNEARDQCDLVVTEKRPAWDWIRDILAEGRAAYILSGGKYKMIVDSAKTPGLLYTEPGNILEGSVKREIGFENKSVNTIRGEFPDDQKDFKTNFVELQDSGIGGDPIKDLNFTFFSLTRESNVYRELMYHLKRRLLVKRRFRWTSPLGAIVSEPLDVVRLGYKTYDWKRGYSGTVLDQPALNIFYLDREVELLSGKTYKLIVRKMDNSSSNVNSIHETTITSPAGLHGQVDFSPAFGTGITPGDMWAISEDGVEVIDALIESIKPTEGGQIEITASEYYSGVYNLDPLPSRSERRFFRIPQTLPLPLWDAQVTEEAILNHDGSTASVLHFDITPGLVKIGGNALGGDGYALLWYVTGEGLPNPPVANYFKNATLNILNGTHAGKSALITLHQDPPIPAYNQLHLDQNFSPAIEAGAKIEVVRTNYEATGGFVIELGETASGPWTEIAEVKGFHHEMDASGGARTLYYRFTPVSIRGVRNTTARWVKSLAFTGDTSAPGPPTNVAMVAGVNRVKISWDNTTAIDLDRVRIYRHTSNDFSGAALVGEIRGTVFSDDQLAAGTYYFWLSSVDFSGNEGSRHRGDTDGQSIVITSVFDSVAPAIPTGLVLGTSGRIANDGNFIAEITAAWTNNTESDLAGYIIEWKRASELWGNSLQMFSDANFALIDFLEGSIAFDVRIRAVDTSGNKSGWSNSAQITTTDSPGAPAQVVGVIVIPGPLIFVVAWAFNPETDIAYYELEVDDNSGMTSPVLAARVNANQFELNINVANVTRWFRVRAVRRTGIPGNWSAIVSGTTLWQDGAQILANTITETKIADDSISTPKLQANAVTANEIAAATITATQLRTDIAVITNSAQIANLLVGNQHIADATITSAKIGSAQILTANIGNLNVTSIKIANNAVTNKAEGRNTNPGGGNMVTLNVTMVSGNSVLILGRATAIAGTPGSSLNDRFGVRIRIRRNGSERDIHEGSNQEGAGVTLTAMDLDSPGSGTHQYILHGETWFDSTDNGFNWDDAVLLVTEYVK